MISLTNHDFQGSGEQWGRYNLPRYYIYIHIYIYIFIYIYNLPVQTSICPGNSHRPMFDHRHHPINHPIISRPVVAKPTSRPILPPKQPSRRGATNDFCSRISSGAEFLWDSFHGMAHQQKKQNQTKPWRFHHVSPRCWRGKVVGSAIWDMWLKKAIGLEKSKLWNKWKMIPQRTKPR